MKSLENPCALLRFVAGTTLLAAALLLAPSIEAQALRLVNRPVRIATFNASLSPNAGNLIERLTATDDSQALAVAEIIQRVNPDVLLLNEFDFDAAGEAIALFQQNYLEIGQNGQTPVEYPYVFLAPSNTGVSSGFDLNNDNSVGGPNDAFGFGLFPGQFAMVLLSKFPILNGAARTFQTFQWADMPGALLPDDPNTPEPADWFSQEELEIFRLSSKSHWDVPIVINGQIVHALAAHPTPPVFDGAEDANGRRNHDEIRLWADYISPGRGDYIYDDKGRAGGLRAGESFVILGDYNADPFDGDSTMNAILQLLNAPQVNTSVTPESAGGPDAAERQNLINDDHIGDPAFDTADFAEENFGGPGNLRVDYALPSENLPIAGAGVFWPTDEDPLFALVGDFPFVSSDHRLTWVDVTIGPRRR